MLVEGGGGGVIADLGKTPCNVYVSVCICVCVYLHYDNQDEDDWMLVEGGGGIIADLRALGTRLHNLHCHIALDCPISVIS